MRILSLAYVVLFAPLFFVLIYILNVLAAHGHSGIGVILLLAHPMFGTIAMVSFVMSFRKTA